MNGKIPHLVQYQGSKRTLAPQILQYMPRCFSRLIEPFSGMAAITIAASFENRAKHYYINDLNRPIITLLQTMIDAPEQLITQYAALWEEQFNFKEGHEAHFYHVRDCFNAGNENAEYMLYLLARCVKGAVRYGKNGKFNQSPDKRRHGTTPKNVAQNVRRISAILNGKISFSSMDYREVIEEARSGDLVYMDPPYQGVTNTRDNRYFAGVDFKSFAEAIEVLNRKGVDYLISYDGECGGKVYGEELSKELGCQKILLKAGVSTQATLLGRRQTTYESLYVSKKLCSCVDLRLEQTALFEAAI